MAAWHELFALDREPTMEDIAGYIDHPLWARRFLHLHGVGGLEGEG